MTPEIEYWSYTPQKPPKSRIVIKKADSKVFSSLSGTKMAQCDSESCSGSTTVWRRTLHKGGGWECTSCSQVVKSRSLKGISPIPDFFHHSTRGQRAEASKVSRKQGERVFKRAETRLNLRDDYRAGMSVRKLGAKYGMSKSSMHRYIQRMETLNWVHKPKAKRKSRAKNQPRVVAKSLNLEDLRRIRDL